MGLFKKLFGEKEVGPYKDITTEVISGESEYKPIIMPLDLMKVNFEKAENQSNRKDEVRAIVLHHIYMGTFKQNVDFLVSKASGVSCHYVLGRNAELTQMVNTKKKAWHAGISKWTIDGVKRSNLNNCTIGIEIVNPGVLTYDADDEKYYCNRGGKTVAWAGDEPKKCEIVYPSGKVLSGYGVQYPEKQLKKLVALCKALIEKYPQIGQDDILTHYGIGRPEGRKNDPFGLDVDELKKLIFE